MNLTKVKYTKTYSYLYEMAWIELFCIQGQRKKLKYIAGYQGDSVQGGGDRNFTSNFPERAQNTN